MVLFQEQFNADLEVFRPFYIDKDTGLNEPVFNAKTFIQI